MDLIKAANLGLRFLLELGALAALAYWGYHAGSGRAVKLGLAVGVPLLAAIVWGLFVAPNATVKAPGAIHLLLQVLIFGAAALGLAAAGRDRLALIFAALVIVNAILMALWGQ